MLLKTPDDWIAECHQCMDEASKIAEPLSETQFNWKPNKDKWSVGECFEHLIITGMAMVPHLERAVKKGHDKKIYGEPPFYAGKLGTWFLKGSGVKGKPMPAPGLYRPKQSHLDKKQTLNEFKTLQEEFISLVERSEGLDLQKIRARSAFTTFMRFNVATWFQSFPGHQFRHLAQMKRVIESEGFPK